MFWLKWFLYKVSLADKSKYVFFLSELYLHLLLCNSLIFLSNPWTVSYFFKRDILCLCYFSICEAISHLKTKSRRHEYTSQMMVLVWDDTTQIVCSVTSACLKHFPWGKIYVQREFSPICRENGVKPQLHEMQWFIKPSVLPWWLDRQIFVTLLG